MSGPNWMRTFEKVIIIEIPPFDEEDCSFILKESLAVLWEY